MTKAYACATLRQLAPPWGERFPAEQARIVLLLVERVDVQIDRVDCRHRPSPL